MPKQKLFPVVAADLAAWLFKKPEHTRSQLIISIDRYLGRLGTLELDTRWPEVGETRINEAVRAALEERDEDATIPGGGALKIRDNPYCGVDDQNSAKQEANIVNGISNHYPGCGHLPSRR